MNDIHAKNLKKIEEKKNHVLVRGLSEFTANSAGMIKRCLKSTNSIQSLASSRIPAGLPVTRLWTFCPCRNSRYKVYNCLYYKQL